MREKKSGNVEIGNRVKKIREGAGLTQERFAELLQVSPHYVSDLERGLVGMSIPTLTKLCRRLSISSDAVIMDAAPENEVEELVAKLRRMPPEQLDFCRTMMNKLSETIAASQN